MRDGTILVILALALIVGAVLMGIFNHPWLCLLFIACFATLSIRTKYGSDNDDSTT